MTEEQKEDIKLLKELIADTSIPNDDREIYQEALNQILAQTKSDMPKEAKEKMPRKAKASKKPKAEKPTALPSDVDAMKKAIKERTGKTEAECEDIIAQYRMLRNKAKVNGAKRIAKLKSSDDLITGTNVITPVAQIEKDAEIVKAKIEKQVEQIENKAEREVVTKDKTKDEVKIAVEKKVIKELAKLSDDMVLKSTTFVKNIQTELKKVDKTEAKNFLLGLRNEIDALLSKFGDGGGISKVYEVGIDLGDEGTHTIANFDNKADAKKFIYDYQLRYPKAKLFIDSVTSDFLNSQQKFEDGGTTEIYNIAEMNSSSSSVNPSKFANGGGINTQIYQEPINNLNRRLKFINEDINRVFKYAPKELLDFKVEGWEDIRTLLSNIDIASDLTDNESDDWRGSKINMAKGGGVRTGSDGREYPFGSAWALEHNKNNKSEKYEIPTSSRKS